MMKFPCHIGWIFLCLSTFFCTACPAYLSAQDRDIINPQAIFNEGNYLMEQQEFTQALDSFHLIKDKGYISGPLFYNMALSYIYLDSIGLASYYLHRSAGYRETTQEASNGLVYIDDRIQNRGTRLPSVPWYSFIDWFLFEFNHYFWLFFSLLVLNIGVLSVIAAWLFHPKRTFILAGGSVAILGTVLSITTAGILLWAQGYHQAVVIKNEVVLHPYPTETVPSGHQPDLAYEAYTVTLSLKETKKEAGWAYIRMQNGASGWVPESAIRVL
ncbi:hypothetical protein QLX67_12175 [Balneolaceae bacterium ANBcel3]|nr:hypothetical protein [Balneolaceae bacterium ANBcel3]